MLRTGHCEAAAADSAASGAATDRRDKKEEEEGEEETGESEQQKPPIDQVQYWWDGQTWIIDDDCHDESFNTNQDAINVVCKSSLIVGKSGMRNIPQLVCNLQWM